MKIPNLRALSRLKAYREIFFLETFYTISSFHDALFRAQSWNWKNKILKSWDQRLWLTNF